MKMKKSSLILGITFFSTILSLNLSAQDNIASMDVSLGMAEVAKLANGSSAPISLTLTAGAAGEAVVTDVVNDDGRLLISSVLGTASITRKITASVAGVPAGTLLKLRALDPTGGSGAVGAVGTVNATIQTLNATAVTLVTAIGSCYSGTTLGTSGYPLEFTYSVGSTDDYDQIRASGGATATVTFTLAAES